MADATEVQSNSCLSLMADGLPCGRPAVSQGLCVLHTSEDSLKGDEFFAEVRRVIDGSSAYARDKACIDASGFVFPNESRFSFDDFSWTRRCVFRKARFYTALFNTARFDEEADFSEAFFINTYGGPEFGGPARFRGAEFDTFRFKGATFKNLADFSGIKTMEDSYLQRCTFRAEARFEGISTGELHCHDTDFQAAVTFRNSRLRHAGGFSSVRFGGTLDARGLHVSQQTDCDPFVREAGDVDFGGASFQQAISFRRSVIRGPASFREVSFASGVAFAGAKFGADAAFVKCGFGGDTDFSGTIFDGAADFSRAHFARNTAFSDTVFRGIADFEGCRFSEPSKVHFVRVNDTDENGARFRFADASLEGVHFEGVHWHREGGRLVLQDELDNRALSARQAESLESAYRRLYAIFHSAYRYSDAEDCVMGAMEMRRRNPRVDKLTRMMMLLYRLASFYGSSYRRAFLVLLLLVLGVFPTIYMLPAAHLREKGGTVDLWSQVAHRHSSGETRTEHLRLAMGAGFRYYRASAFYSTELSAFRDDPSFVLDSPLRGLVFVEQAAVATQLALLLLAVRRRFAQ